MTLADVEGVLFDDKVLMRRTATEQAEARNHKAALDWLLQELFDTGDKFIIDEALLRNIHLRLMNGIMSDAGLYRRHGVRIAGSAVALSNWVKIPDQLEDLFEYVNQPHGDSIAALAITHARLEQIHPFADGNGRVGRLIMLAQALHAGLVPPLVVKERKYAYYKYLQLAQTQENYMPLELFVAESVLTGARLLELM